MPLLNSILITAILWSFTNFFSKNRTHLRRKVCFFQCLRVEALIFVQHREGFFCRHISGLAHVSGAVRLSPSRPTKLVNCQSQIRQHVSQRLIVYNSRSIEYPLISQMPFVQRKNEQGFVIRMGKGSIRL